MKFDVFFSICQTEVDGYLPSETVMFQNFLDQVVLADDLGFGVAWVAETHLSCEIQKHGSQPVIPHFRGEIGLNTDILQVAHVILAKTKRIEIGSAIRNILFNGGPVAHAEAVKTYLALRGLEGDRDARKLHLGFASGRFEFSNRPYGIVPRDEMERVAWPVIKGKILLEATEIFLRLLKGEKIAREDCAMRAISRADFRSDEHWQQTLAAYGKSVDQIPLAPFWNFERVGVIPFEVDLNRLALTIGTHDPKAQDLANSILPTGVFNLSITPPEIIEATHARMNKTYLGGGWRRDLMPRTAMVFLDATPGLSAEEQSSRAKHAAEKAWKNYWLAMEGTLDQRKVDQAVGNALVGSPEEVAMQIRERFHPEDRLMLWFDFNNHNNEMVKQSMVAFKEQVIPRIN